MRHGFVHTKQEIKYLVLYAMNFLPFPVDMETIVDLCTWCDDGFGYFELQEAFDEMLKTGHVVKIDEKYEITKKGREALEVFERNIPYSVREAAQQSALRVVHNIKRDAAITTESQKLSEHDILVTMSMEDVFTLKMNVVSEGQASLLQKNFKKNAEKIYQSVLNAVINEK